MELPWERTTAISQAFFESLTEKIGHWTGLKSECIAARVHWNARRLGMVDQHVHVVLNLVANRLLADGRFFPARRNGIKANRAALVAKRALRPS
jgi:hypothetical protein